MEAPRTQYVDRGGKSMAYQTLGEGPRAVVLFMEIISHLDLLWTDPAWARQVRRLAGLGRVVMFQQMGLGLSDRIERVPTLEEQAADIGAVMDAEAIEHATVFGVYSTAMAAVLFAAQSPARVNALVLWCPLVHGLRHAGPDHTAGFTPAEGAVALAGWDDVFSHWGEGRAIDVWDPAIAARNRPAIAMLERTSASPAVAAAVYEASATSDVRGVLPLVRAPTRVLYHPTYALPQRSVRLAAELIPDATFHVLPRSAPYMSLADASAACMDHVAAAMSGRPRPATGARDLATLLFTDIVGSTELVARYGDAEWSDLLGRHEEQIRATVDAAGGDLVKMIGDGSLSVFVPTAACLRCAREIVDQARALGLRVRAGVHTGECERRAGDVSGLAVHIAARVAAEAGPGEIWVSSAVRDLVGGSGLLLRPRGTHRLRGVPGPWELYALDRREEDVRVEGGQRHGRAGDRLATAAARRVPRLVRAVTRLEAARRARRG